MRRPTGELPPDRDDAEHGERQDPYGVGGRAHDTGCRIGARQRHPPGGDPGRAGIALRPTGSPCRAPRPRRPLTLGEGGISCAARTEIARTGSERPGDRNRARDTPPGPRRDEQRSLQAYGRRDPGSRASVESRRLVDHRRAGGARRPGLLFLHRRRVLPRQMALGCGGAARRRPPGLTPSRNSRPASGSRTRRVLQRPRRLQRRTDRHTEGGGVAGRGRWERVGPTAAGALSSERNHLRPHS